tara:strand:+ start:181 stop:345 length:165 start_codon:yes stop_codon:yes gene_type:complete
MIMIDSFDFNGISLRPALKKEVVEIQTREFYKIKRRQELKRQQDILNQYNSKGN